MMFSFTPISDATFLAQILGELPEAGAGLNTGTLVAAKKLRWWLDYTRDQAFEALLPIVSERRNRDCTREVWRQVNTAYESGDAYSGATGPSGTHYEFYKRESLLDRYRPCSRPVPKFS